MGSIQRFSDTVIEYAERLSNVADAAAGRRATRGRNGGAVTTTRWVFLPAVGAGLYALVKSDSFTRQAKEVMGEATARASDLPTDLMKAVRQSSPKSTQQRSSTPQRSTTQRSRSRSGSQRSKSQRSGAQRRRQTTSNRSNTSG
jgi:hypothetical protein